MGLDWVYPAKSLQWPKLCNGIVWMVLVEDRGDYARRGDELWKGSGKGVEESKQNLA